MSFDKRARFFVPRQMMLTMMEKLHASHGNTQYCIKKWHSSAPRSCVGCFLSHPTVSFRSSVIEKKASPLGRSWRACLFLHPRWHSMPACLGRVRRGPLAGHRGEMGMPVGCSEQQAYLLAHYDLPEFGGHQLDAVTLAGRPQLPSALDRDIQQLQHNKIRVKHWISV